MKRYDVTWEELNPEPYDNTDAVALLREVTRLKEGIFEMYHNAQTLYDNERPIAPDWLMARCADLVGIPE